MNPLIGADYSAARPSRAQLDSGGVSFAVRYILDAARDGGKRFTLTEAQTLTSWGRKLVCNFEYQTGHMAAGAAAGAADARVSLAEMRTLGVPLGRPCFFSNDTGSVPDAAIVSYLGGAAGVLGPAGYQTGIYGGLRSMQVAYGAGYLWLWQTYAWSGSPTVWHPNAVLRQVHNGAFTGWDGDLDFAQTADFGQWDTTGWTPTGDALMAMTDAQLGQLMLAVARIGDMYTMQAGNYVGRFSALEKAVATLGTAVAALPGAPAAIKAELDAVKAAVDRIGTTVAGGLTVALTPEQLAALSAAIGVSPQMIVDAVKRAEREGSGA